MVPPTVHMCPYRQLRFAESDSNHHYNAQEGIKDLLSNFVIL
jgi:hypothetical protein